MMEAEWNSRRILVADRDSGSLQRTAEALENEGWQVSIAGDGLQALRALARQAFDCVAIDLRLPGVNGYDLLRRVRDQSPATSRLAITRGGGTRLAAVDPQLFHAVLSLAQLRGLNRDSQASLP